MKSRPDYVHCIKSTDDGHQGFGPVFCAREIFMSTWLYQNLAHAVASLTQNDRMVPCPKCLERAGRVDLAKVAQERIG